LKIVATDENGAYHFSRIKVGECTIMVQHPSYSYERRVIVVDADTQHPDVDFSLQPGLTLRGKATARATGNAARNLYIEIREPGGALIVSEDIAVDSLGNYMVRGLREGTYSLDAYAENLAPLYNYTVTITAEGDNVLDLLFNRGGTLELVVVNDAGEGVEHAKVNLLNAQGQPIGYPLSLGALMNLEEVFFTDADGRLERRNIPAGSYTLKIEATGFQNYQAPISITEEGIALQNVTMME
jgi:hypothetical protein